MEERAPFSGELPAAVAPALRIIHTLTDAGHVAFLNGGCVRDLLLGNPPQDYDVATDAPPERVAALFKPTRKVGAHFGVMLVRSQGAWIEVATFRTDGPYLDGRRPTHVTFGDARGDAERRDFTINGMFLDPVGKEIIDYVGGRADLAAKQIRAIGNPAARFGEDYLRLLRAVRFAARLEFSLEAQTATAIAQQAAHLPQIAPERIRQELEKILAHASRARGFEMLATLGLLEYLWPNAKWSAGQRTAAIGGLTRLPSDSHFECAMAITLHDRSSAEVAAVCRSLSCSNEQRDAILFLVRHQADLDAPEQPTLAAFKRLLAAAEFRDLRDVAIARYRAIPDADDRIAQLDARIRSIPPATIAPPPFVSGNDLAERGVPPGPLYKRILDELYTRQLNDQVVDRSQGLRELDERLKAGGAKERK